MRRNTHIGRAPKIRITKNAVTVPTLLKQWHAVFLGIMSFGIFAGVFIRMFELDHELKALTLVPALFTGTLITLCLLWLFSDVNRKALIPAAAVLTLCILTLGIYLYSRDMDVRFFQEFQQSPVLYMVTPLLALAGVGLGYVMSCIGFRNAQDLLISKFSKLTASFFAPTSEAMPRWYARVLSNR